ncbi:PREDICTED: probable serine/threonine-protein kinase DDB_G0277165 [Ipomoea nil]|uniref:probable serine/threonine-protein kinase DDB_G0277165 n=1 Tax=Ipomoea nil TaxID=35883 RepID=UPI000900C28D|nr:PREDICTED: probable serine/threonine-protein kinase DDB_G0277165 [Ipomoea nil]
MDQFRQIGEVVGSMKALMVLKHDVLINQRQCCLLFDVCVQAFDNICDEIRQNLRLDERSTKWKPLERPLRELHWIIKESESYIKNCIDIRSWMGKAISLHSSRDCVEFHIHNVVSCFVVVIEAIEAAAEVSGLNDEDMQKRRVALLRKYGAEWNEARLFQWKYGSQYLVPREMCTRLESVWNEDRWILLEALRQKKQTKLVEDLIKKVDRPDTNHAPIPPANLLPTSLLLEANDYCVKRRIGTPGSHLKEVQWLGESFALRTFYGEIGALRPEIATVMSLSHPNVLQYHCGFYDEERKEGFLVMELMSKSLDMHIKENSGQRKRMSFSIPVAVDVMLQIARGMEYLHSRNIFHGELNPSNILLRPMSSPGETYFHSKVSGFGLSMMKSQYTFRNCPRASGGVDPVIWYAPEVLAEQEQPRGSSKSGAKFSEKADVYSFGMLCFQILTGKAPFEEGERPLQGDKMVHSLMAGERPLFPYPLPKYLTNLIRKCWHTSPNARPGFSSVCRILRYIKKVLVINPEHGHPDCPPPLVDYCDIEAGYIKKFPGDNVPPGVSEIPFQMFAYKLVEKEKTLGNDGFAVRARDDHLVSMDDLCLVPNNGTRGRLSTCSEIIDRNDLGTFADQRSAISEILQPKLLLSDNILDLSDNLLNTADESPAFVDTPEWKLLSELPPDHQTSPHVETPGNKNLSSTSTSKKLSLERVASKPKVQPRIVSCDSAEKKQKQISSEATGKKDSSEPESTRKKLLRTMKTKFRLTKIPEKKTLSAANSQSSNSPESPHKAAITLKPTKPKLSFKNAIFHPNFKGEQSSKEHGKNKYKSPGASPARLMTRSNSMGLHASSSISSPMHPMKLSSPARVTPSTRALKTASSPFSSPMHPLKLSSPARVTPSTRALNASPSPGFRGTRDKARELYMSPRRQMKAPA